MNFRLITQTMGYILWVEAGFLLLPALTACVCGEVYWRQFLLTAALCAAVGTGLRLIPVKKAQMHSRDGFVAVALSWVLLSLFGALPYVFTGAMTSYIDALFETVSGLTTTGSSTFTAVSHLPRSVLLWRSLTQWMGGMGVLVLFLALTPRMGEGAVFLMRAESPGPIKSKLVPKVGGTAKILYTIYVVLTACEIAALRIAGESWFSAINHSFTTMATGGFSIYDTSLAGASKAVMWIVTVFSFLAGVNFSLMFLAVRGKLKEVLRSEELRIYVGIVAAATLLLCINLRVQAGIPFGDSITDAAFQTVTIMTTTGFATVDFSLWPTFCRMALVMLMFTGACAGSTSGGIKISRVAILCKSLKRELKRLAHPHHVSVLKVDGQAVEERVVASAGAFIAAYLLVLLAGALVVSWDNYGFQESFAASLTCISNVGPGLGILGPMENFSILSPLSKLVLLLEMLMGRLEHPSGVLFRICCVSSVVSARRADIGLVLLLQPALQRLHALLVPREVPLLLVLRQLIAQVGIHGGVQHAVVLVPGEAIAEFSDGAGVYERPVEPCGRQFSKLRMHDGHSFRL